MTALPPFAEHAAAVAIDHDPVPADQVVAGRPTVGIREVWCAPNGAADVGVWEITPGTVTDVEVDEVFVVLAGRATIAFQDGPTLEVAPGDVVVLRDGDRTTWTVHETLRKVYMVVSAQARDRPDAPAG